ncbi:MAG: PilZ domain-containing protein [Kiritimatiellia bacterium]
MQERRAKPRLQEEHQAEVEILSSPEKQELELKRFECETKDISASGLRLVLPVALSVGSRLEIKLFMNHPRRVFWHVGRVVWVKSLGDNSCMYMVGVHFSETPEETLHLWEDLLLEKLARLKDTRGGIV